MTYSWALTSSIVDIFDSGSVEKNNSLKGIDLLNFARTSKA